MVKKRGFTLVELVVVVAIIAMLVALLVPSLARARCRVKQVLCMSNMRGIGTALLIYVQNNEDYFLYLGEIQNYDPKNMPRTQARSADMPNNETKYDRVRSSWVHEDALINHRLTWLLASQSLLFAGYSVLLEICTATERIERLIWWIPLLGIVTSLLLLVSITAAIAAMWCLRREYHDLRLDVNRATTIAGFVAPISLPVVFVFAWVMARMP